MVGQGCTRGSCRYLVRTAPSITSSTCIRSRALWWRVPSSSGLVAVTETGSPIPPEIYSKAYRRHCATARVPVIRLFFA